MKRLIMIALLLSCIAGQAAVAEEAARPASPEARTLKLFQQCLEDKDWEMAEVVAHGALIKFGTECVLIANMRSQAETAVEGNLTLLRRFEFLPTLNRATVPAPVQVCRVYDVQDLLTTPDGRLVKDTDKRLSQLADELKQVCFADDDELDFSVSPFPSNLSLVVSAPAEGQDKVAAYLKLQRVQ